MEEMTTYLICIRTIDLFEEGVYTETKTLYSEDIVIEKNTSQEFS